MTDLELENPETPKKSPDYNKVLALYLGFIFVVLFQFPLAPMVQVVSVILLFILVSCIGFIRKESEKDSYIYNHATFLSRTLWMWSLLLAISVMLAGVYISDAVKLSVEDVMSLSQDLMSGNTSSPLIAKMMPIAIGAMVPSTLYISVRYIMGLSAAFRDKFLPRPKSFF